MILGKFWEDRVTGFEVIPDEWRPRNKRVWKRFVKAATRLKMKQDEVITVFFRAPCSKERFKELKGSVNWRKKKHGI